MGLFNFSEAQIFCFILVLVRTTAFFVSWPVLSGLTVNPMIRTLMALTVALFIMTILPSDSIRGELLATGSILAVIRESIVGLCLGFVCRFLFMSIVSGAQLISTSIGISQGQLYNPFIESGSTPVDQFYVAMATLLFLAINGHHYLLNGFMQSFDLVPLHGGFPSAVVFRDLTMVMTTVLELAIKMSAPVLVAILFVNFAMGILGRVVPQINVLITAMPVNALVGFMIMLFSLPIFIPQLKELSADSVEQMFLFMKAF